MGLSRTERAQQYVERLRSASNLRLEAIKIKEEVASLIKVADEKPLSLEEKLAILDATTRILSEGFVKKAQLDVRAAADNKEILDVINDIRKETEKNK